MVFFRPTLAAAVTVAAAVLIAPGRSPLQAQAAPNLSGIWQRTRTVAPNPATLPLNARGVALREAIDESLAPMYDCVPATIPHILGDPYNFSIEQRPDRVIFRFEKDAVTRTAWLGGRDANPGDYALHGYSKAKYEGNTLVVDTRFYTFDPGGLEDKPPMIPSSTQKRTIERYTRNGDTLTVDVELADPLILKEPVKFQFQFRPTKDALVEWPECDLEQARAPINYMPLNQLKYGIR
jgi:hypothetical protein